MTPTLTIFRGLPGSGKTTHARELAEKTGAMLIEPDSLTIKGGKYCYTPAAHAHVQAISLEILETVGSVGSDAIYADVLPSIALVNDVIRAYAKRAPDCYFRVCDMPLLTVEQSLARNRHNVRREDIERMAAQWEPWERKQEESENG